MHILYLPNGFFLHPILRNYIELKKLHLQEQNFCCILELEALSKIVLNLQILDIARLRKIGICVLSCLLLSSFGSKLWAQTLSTKILKSTVLLRKNFRSSGSMLFRLDAELNFSEAENKVYLRNNYNSLRDFELIAVHWVNLKSGIEIGKHEPISMGKSAEQDGLIEQEFVFSYSSFKPEKENALDLVFKNGEKRFLARISLEDYIYGDSNLEDQRQSELSSGFDYSKNGRSANSQFMNQQFMNPQSQYMQVPNPASYGNYQKELMLYGALNPFIGEEDNDSNNQSIFDQFLANPFPGQGFNQAPAQQTSPFDQEFGDFAPSFDDLGVPDRMDFIEKF